MPKQNRDFWESAMMNTGTFDQYYMRLVELSVSMFEWKNLPDTVDPRYLELALLTYGRAVFFKDEVLGYLGLNCTIGGQFNVYRIPIKRRAYAANGYNRELNDKNSVIIFNNYLHTGSRLDIEMFARRLYNLDRTIDVNVNAQKTPLLIQCEQNQVLTMKNLYMKFEGNMPFIIADKNLNPNSIKVLQTGAPYVADRLYELKTKIWNEALTYLGISNLTINKKERLITDEVEKNNGGTIASRFSRLETRRQAAKQINDMFGLNIEVNYREDTENTDAMPESEGDLK